MLSHRQRFFLPRKRRVGQYNFKIREINGHIIHGHRIGVFESHAVTTGHARANTRLSGMKQRNATLFLQYFIERISHSIIGKETLHGRVKLKPLNLVFTHQSPGFPNGHLALPWIDGRKLTLNPDTVVKYLFTSGSTGSPKAVINTNRMICSMQAMVRDCYRFLEHHPPVVLDWLPWNHTAAGNKVFYLVLTNGGTYYIDDGRPVAGKFDETLRNLREIACTWYFTVPVGYDLLVQSLENDTELASHFYSKLDMLFYAGAGMAQHTWTALMQIGKKVTGRDILLATGLGSTETAPFALTWTELEQTAGNVGVSSRGLTMKLVPTDGKLKVRLIGPSITPGYYAEPELTAEVFDEEVFIVSEMRCDR